MRTHRFVLALVILALLAGVAGLFLFMRPDPVKEEAARRAARARFIEIARGGNLEDMDVVGELVQAFRQAFRKGDPAADYEAVLKVFPNHYVRDGYHQYDWWIKVKPDPKNPDGTYCILVVDVPIDTMIIGSFYCTGSVD
jgi:hypothetical protein